MGYIAVGLTCRAALMGLIVTAALMELAAEKISAVGRFIDRVIDAII